MEDKNQSCLVLQSDLEGNIIGIDITTTYNYWEKDAFIAMNYRQLFPYKENGVKFKNYTDWHVRTNIYTLSNKVSKGLKSLFNLQNTLPYINSNIQDFINNINLPNVIYPGYD